MKREPRYPRHRPDSKFRFNWLRDAESGQRKRSDSQCVQRELCGTAPSAGSYAVSSIRVELGVAPSARMMVKFPIIPVHVLFDHQSLAAPALVALGEMAQRFDGAADACEKSIRIGVICVGHVATIRDSVEEIGAHRSMLSQAFERVADDYQRFDSEGEGFSASEVLLFMTVQPDDDWRIGWARVEQYRSLIISYWLDPGPETGMGADVRDAITQLLTQISPTEPGPGGGPRHKLAFATSGVADFVDEAVSRLEGRIRKRMEQMGQLRHLQPIRKQ